MNIIESSLSINYPSAVVNDTRSRFTFDFDFDYDNSTSIPSVEDHKKLLKHSLRVAKYWSWLCIPFALIGSMRWYIWILYAQDLGEYNHTKLAFVVYASYFVQGCGSMLWATIGDKYQYDKIATILAIINVCAAVIESIAPTFNILVIGTMLLASSRGVGALSIAFVAKYLPNDYAIKYTSYLYALAASAYLVGPVISGIIVHFFGYRAVYFACAIILVLCLIFIFVMISGTQKPLEMKQRRMRELYIALANSTPSIVSSNTSKIKINLLCENSQFPICIERFGFIQSTENSVTSTQEDITITNPSIDHSLNLTERLVDNMDLDSVNDGFSINAHDRQIKQKGSYYSWFLMITTLIANACLLGIEGVTSTYYLLYCDQEFDENIITATMQIALYVLLFITACVITPPMLKCLNKRNGNENSVGKKSYNYEYIVLLVGHCINIPLYFFIWQRVQHEGYMRWVMMCFAGIGLGVTNMTQEVMLLEFQPKQHAGKVSGAKTMARQFMKAFACLAVGVLWIKQVYWFLWVMGYLFAISLFLTVIMFLVEKYQFFMLYIKRFK
eukprot:153116_1